MGLNLSKLVSLFSILFLAALAACLIFIMEHCSDLCGCKFSTDLAESEKSFKMVDFLNSNNIPISWGGLEFVESMVYCLKQALEKGKIGNGPE